MATKTTTKPDIRFVVDVRPNRYSTDRKRLDAVVYPVIMEDGKIRNCSWSSLGDRGAEFADLKIEGWIDQDSRNDIDFYFGHEPLEYREIFALDLQRAEVIVKTLRSLKKKIDALNNKFGYPQDYAGFLGYLAVAIGAGSGCVFARRVSNGGSTYDDGEYRWMDVNALRYHFQTKIKDWKEGK